MLSHAVASSSPAGNWGESTRKLNGYANSETTNFLSMTQENYGYAAVKEEKEKQENKYAKFVRNNLVKTSQFIKLFIVNN